MENIVSKLIMYGDMPADSILMKLCDVSKRAKDMDAPKDELVIEAYRQIKRLLVLATSYGFDNNLWHNYLTFLLITDENPFSITCEKVGAKDGSANIFAKNDFKAFYELFHYDFSWLQERLGIDSFDILENYKAIGKPELMYNKNVSEKVRGLSLKLGQAEDADEIFELVTGFYKAYGVGMFMAFCAASISRVPLPQKGSSTRLSRRTRPRSAMVAASVSRRGASMALRR